MNAETVNKMSELWKAWSGNERSDVASSDGLESRPSYPYVVVIDEPGMGYAEPCYSYQAAMRAAKRLRDKGYNAVIKRMKH